MLYLYCINQTDQFFHTTTKLTGGKSEKGITFKTITLHEFSCLCQKRHFKHNVTRGYAFSRLPWMNTA